MRILLMGLVTLTLFPLLAILIDGLVNEGLSQHFKIFSSNQNLLVNILLGAFTGLGFGIVAWQLIISDYMKPVLDKYGTVVSSLNLNFPTIIFISICAGVGEEWFFRGVLQDYLGVWLTAMLFVAIHGYLDPRNVRVMVYGTYMTLVIAVIGYMDIYVGLTSAMLAHTFIDIVLFYKLTNYKIDSDRKLVR